jgi:methylmalonyl-CoA/ethylmalonyl-CoA epimerase
MITRIDHVAIAVNDYKSAYDFFSKILGAIPGSHASDDRMKYLWQNMTLGDLTRLELLTPTGKGSFLDNFLKDKAGGVHHITMQTPDIRKTKEMLDNNKIPYFGFREYGEIWKELFIHPRDAYGVLIQIAEFIPDEWLSPLTRMPSGRKFAVKKTKKGCSITFAHPGGGRVSIDLGKEEMKNLADDINGLL